LYLTLRDKQIEGVPELGAGGGGILEGKRDGVSGNWRKLHSEGFYNLYCSPNVITISKLPVKMTGKYNVLDTHSYKYHPTTIRPKIPYQQMITDQTTLAYCDYVTIK
jgi:hypothetical protein